MRFSRLFAHVGFSAVRPTKTAQKGRGENNSKTKLVNHFGQAPQSGVVMLEPNSQMGTLLLICAMGQIDRGAIKRR